VRSWLQRFFVRVLQSLSWRAGLNIMLVMRRDMTSSPAPAPDAVQFHVLDEKEALELAKDPRLDVSADWVRMAVTLALTCVGAFVDGNLVGYTWFAPEMAPDLDGLWVMVPQGAMFRFKAFVRADFRNLGIGRNLYWFADRTCVGLGGQTSLSLVALQNVRARAEAPPPGATVAGFLIVLRAFGRQWVLRSPGARRAGLQMVSGRPDRSASS
jgi:hypothetical protein